MMYQVNGSIKRILGQRLRNYRLSKGLTQGELGEKIGYSAGAISQYELGMKCWSMGVLLLLCQVLEVKPSTFVQGMELYYCSIHPGGLD
jgi:transcriptional regulator with XRE-family HTH domain